MVAQLASHTRVPFSRHVFARLLQLKVNDVVTLLRLNRFIVDAESGLHVCKPAALDLLDFLLGHFEVDEAVGVV